MCIKIACKFHWIEFTLSTLSLSLTLFLSLNFLWLCVILVLSLGFCLFVHQWVCLFLQFVLCHLFLLRKLSGSFSHGFLCTQSVFIVVSTNSASLSRYVSQFFIDFVTVLVVYMNAHRWTEAGSAIEYAIKYAKFFTRFLLSNFWNRSGRLVGVT